MIDPALEDVLVVPEVFADRQPDPQPLVGKAAALLTRLEVAALVEHVIGRQKAFVDLVQNPTVFEQNRGIERPLALIARIVVHEAANDADAADGGQQAVEAGDVGVDEIFLFDQIVRRVAGDNQFRKNDQVAGLRDGLLDAPAHAPAVVGKIPDNRVDLGQSDLHVI